MKYPIPAIAVILAVLPIAACQKRQAARPPAAGEAEVSAAGLKWVEDKPLAAASEYRHRIRMAYNGSDFDTLETEAQSARSSKERFGNGTWKIHHFHDSLGCREDEPESMWQLHDRIHKAWIAAKPESLAARIAHATFLVEYAWHARGHGFASEVTEEGWKLFRERIAAADRVLAEARELEGTDPCYWTVAMKVAKGSGAKPAVFSRIATEAAAAEPEYFETDKECASCLLPRWYGKPGDWEKFAEAAADRPGGLGDETYARIVLHLRRYYKNVFEETSASWPRTRDGLELMCARHPDSQEIRGVAALMAVLAKDREYTKICFDRLGDDFLVNIWRRPERFLQAREWAETEE